MVKYSILVILFLLFFQYGCKKDPSVVQEENGSLELKIVWNKSTDSIPDISPVQNAKVTLSSQKGVQSYFTGADGYIRLSQLAVGTCDISVKATHPLDATIELAGSIKSLLIESGKTSTPTIILKPFSQSGITINEIYSAGPVNNVFYFYDQFTELYNSSDSIKYLDGMQVMRVSGSADNGNLKPGGDWYNDGRMHGVTYIYKFP